MGGTLGFTLRKSPTEQYRMSQWTNMMPWAIDNMKLVNKDPEHIEGLIKTWLEGYNKEDRHWAYSDPYLAPSEYGLVVVDFVNNQILDCNHYHWFGQEHGVGLRNEFNSSRLDDTGYTLGGDGPIMGLKAFFNEHETSASRFYEFYKEKRIKDTLKFNEKTREWESIGEDINLWPIEKIANELINVDFDDCCNFIFDMSPFEITRFDTFKPFYKAVLDLGFILTDKEEEIWAEKIKHDKPPS